MKYCYKNKGLEFDYVTDDYVAASGELVLDEFLTNDLRSGIISGFLAAWESLSKEEKFTILYYQLYYLDSIIPRGLEDFWQVSGFDTSTLPEQSKKVLVQKAKIRTDIRNLA